MWIRIVQFVIRYRLPLIIVIGAITVSMSYYASKARITHSFESVLPADNPDKQYLEQFRKQFGEDGNIVAIGIRDSSLFQLEKFSEFRSFCKELKDIPGIHNVMALPDIKKIEKNTVKKHFEIKDIFPDKIHTQADLDSLMAEVRKQVFYDGHIINMENGATAVLMTIDSVVLNSSKRVSVTSRITSLGNAFRSKTNIVLHYAGLPFIRSIITSQLSKELMLFLTLSIIITGIALFLFFRSLKIILLAMTVIVTAVIWSVGTITLLGFKITLLSGMIPPLMAVIGVPNTIYLINKYHSGFVVHGNKVLAIGRVVQRVGMATFLTNITTAIGFLVLISTNMKILKEFGLVAGINVLAMFFISIILVPGMLSWMKPPSSNHVKHLNLKYFNNALSLIDQWVQGHRKAIYMIVLLVIAIAIGGICQLNTLSYMADDMPKGSRIEKDLAFFEKNFSGVMPLEIIVHTATKKGLMKMKNLKKIDTFSSFAADQKAISKPISLIELIKAARQAFFNGNPKQYKLPNRREQAFLLRYMKGSEIDGMQSFGSFVDSSLQTMRISYHMIDVGSNKMDSLIHQVLTPKINAVFANTPINVKITGTTPVFVQGNKFLVTSLQYSLMLAFGLIAIIMGLLFYDIKMIVISLIPSVIPMMITAALMGYLNIPLKPSTVLIFSLILGISIDYSIHFLTKYRQELMLKKQGISRAISNTILEVGKSMLYTSVVLFTGFIIFTFSSFGGTIALGLLTSSTLAMSAITNLVILPTLIISLNYKKYKSSLPSVPLKQHRVNQETHY